MMEGKIMILNPIILPVIILPSQSGSEICIIPRYAPRVLIIRGFE